MVKTASLSKKSTRDSAIDCHKAAAILMVVGIHSLGYSNDIGVAARSLLHNSLFGVAVTSFFFIDGFLFSGRYLDTNITYGSYILKSCNRLLKPWLVFSVLYLVLRWLFELILPGDERYVIGVLPAKVAINVFASVFVPQTYFLLSLLIIRMVTFPLLRLIRKTQLLFIVGSFCGIICSSICAGLIAPLLRMSVGGQDPVIHGIWGIQFFLAGVLIGRFFKHLKYYAISLSLVSLTVAIVFFTLGGSGLTREVFRYGYILFLFFGFHVISRYVSWLGTIGKYSMGIYLLHAPVLLKVVSMIVLMRVFNGWLSLILVYAMTFGISVLLSIVLQRIQLFRWATGQT